MATDGAYRDVWRLRLRKPARAFQPFNSTRIDRYPHIFAFVQSQLNAEFERRILSFGCSTGEEVYSLRRYFPRASIKGLDINPGNIAACKSLKIAMMDDAIAFEVADSTQAERAASYDAIFCMAVLRHGALASPGVARCDHLIRFEDFAYMIEDFVRCLKPGGLFVIRHSNFRVRDTPAAVRLETILAVPYPVRCAPPIFGPDNRLMAGVVCPDTVFRKLLDTGAT